MHFYSILATITLTISTALAAHQSPLDASTNCLNICKDGPGDYTCPPTTEKTQLSSVSSDYDLIYHYK